MGTVTGKGNYNVTCDICGFVIKADKAKKNWKNQIVCAADFELRHPSDFYVPAQDVFPLPFIRPDNSNIDVGPVINPLTTTTPAPR